ncbi:MAG: phenylalanine--tRNA ligase subunit beta, partial [Omnitrophica WOR_2 bacterium GWA2_47_8]
MKLSYNWLKDYVAVKLPPEKLAHRLTMAGLEVEKIESVNGDSVFELEVTPNRPDCLNVLGLAREVSAILDASLKAPKVEKLRIPSQKIDISVEDKKDCGRYIGTLISDVKVASSARWLEEKLQSIGTRGINNVVDITNFCLMELGQPLHAFDHDKLKGGAIIVRRARSGETIVTIDGVERKLDPSILVIADAQRPVAIAGIMGGRDTEVSERTKNILLESAYFDQVLIRRASRKLGLSSDSSYRFERGVAMQTVETASTRAAELIKKEAGGKVSAQQDVFSKTQKKAAPAIALSLREINDRLGSNLSLAKCKAILNRLGFSVSSSGKDKLRLTAPAFRNDIKENVDIVEEVARIIGYDNLPLSIPRIQVENITIKSNQTHEKKIRGILTALGFDEIITYSMVNQSMLDKTALGHLKGVRVQNPLSQDQEMLRPAVLPSLLSIVLLNLNRGQKDLRLFEIGKVYSCEAEKKMINIVASGSKPGD